MFFMFITNRCHSNGTRLQRELIRLAVSYSPIAFIYLSLFFQQFHSILDHIRDIILATDIANHLQKVKDIKRMAEG